MTIRGLTVYAVMLINFTSILFLLDKNLEVKLTFFRPIKFWRRVLKESVINDPNRKVCENDIEEIDKE